MKRTRCESPGAAAGAEVSAACVVEVERCVVEQPCTRARWFGEDVSAAEMTETARNDLKPVFIPYGRSKPPVLRHTGDAHIRARRQETAHTRDNQPARVRCATYSAFGEVNTSHQVSLTSCSPAPKTQRTPPYRPCGSQYTPLVHPWESPQITPHFFVPAASAVSARTSHINQLKPLALRYS